GLVRHPQLFAAGASHKDRHSARLRGGRHTDVPVPGSSLLRSARGDLPLYHTGARGRAARKNRTVVPVSPVRRGGISPPARRSTPRQLTQPVRRGVERRVWRHGTLRASNTRWSSFSDVISSASAS